jgi:hypothetical protein
VTRFVSGTNETAAAQSTVRLFVAVALDFASGMVRAHDGLGTITWSSNSYEGVGRFGGIDLTEETIDIIAKPVGLQISGVDSALVATALTEVYQGRQATVYFGLVNPETNVLVDTPEVLWEGRMDRMNIKLRASTGEITLSCEHRLRREPRIARYTHADLQIAYSGDRFFDLVPKIAGFRGTWGAKGVSNDLASRSGRYVVTGRKGPAPTYTWVED